MAKEKSPSVSKLTSISSLISLLLLVVPFIMFIYSFILFIIVGHEKGLILWLPVRNIVICLYLIFLLHDLYLSFLHKIKLHLSLLFWIVSLFFSLFSWAFGGLFYDLIRLFLMLLKHGGY